VYATVVGVGDRGGVTVPIVLDISNVGSLRGQNSAVIPFHLTISLRVVGSGEDLLDDQFRTDGQKEFRGELRATIGQQ
jgi:uncharacterized protein related to proFAR isomerase